MARVTQVDPVRINGSGVEWTGIGIGIKLLEGLVSLLLYGEASQK
jgi:hypothetical protein